MATATAVALFAFAAPALADETPSEQYGGADETVTTNAEIRTVVKAMDTAEDQGGEAAAEDVLEGLTEGEQQTVVEKGLTPVEVERGAVEADGSQAVAAKARKHRKGARARAAALATRTITFYCQTKSAVGLILWRYNSRWTWTYGGVEVKAANHDEWGGMLAPGWDYRGSQYLWASGALYTSYIGRAVQGHFVFAPAWTFFTALPILNVHVHGDGGYWYQCTEN